MGIHKYVAEQMGQSLLDQHFLLRMSDPEWLKCDESTSLIFANDSSIYRLREEEDPLMLNYKRIFSGYLRPHNQIVGDMHAHMMSIMQTFFPSLLNETPGADGKISQVDTRPIDYKSIMRSPDYKKFVHCSIELQMVQPSTIKHEELPAFFVNLYNLATFHANLEKIQAMGDRGTAGKRLFSRLRGSKFGYLIGGLHYSLSEMENGIIRGNRKPQRVFQQKDPRLAYASTTFDPHIHFLLGWMGSSTDLPIRLPRLYTHMSLMTLMQEMAVDFLNSDEVRISQNGNQKVVVLPWIFNVYKFDFGRDRPDILTWIANQIFDDSKKRELLQLSADPQLRIVFEGGEEGPDDHSRSLRPLGSSNDQEYSQSSFIGHSTSPNSTQLVKVESDSSVGTTDTEDERIGEDGMSSSPGSNIGAWKPVRKVTSQGNRTHTGFLGENSPLGRAHSRTIITPPANVHPSGVMSTPTSPDLKRTSSELRKNHSFSDTESSDGEFKSESISKKSLEKSPEDRKGDSLGRTKSEKGEDKTGVRKMWKSFRAVASMGGRDSKNSAIHEDDEEEEKK
eukprot:TRINITY_DN2711_c0_g1_i3.p1 TRINITY_DN2711_c0_g1~~TRINITY_DN2711_c0_g1_i3.p1  ORF type:complete len:562 (-),score=142.60 TRINITY_DN2711_c0_g1_i3:99-1784(-)